jgi:hypothetical protein
MQTLPTTVIAGINDFQGFVEFLVEKSRKQVKQLLTNETHREKANGKPRQQVAYCSKEANARWIKGIKELEEPDAKEKRAKRSENWLKIRKDATTIEQDAFIETHSRGWILRRNAIERLMVDSMGRTARKWNGDLKDKNIWLWGSTSTGKSRWADQQAPARYLLKKYRNKWWEGENAGKCRVAVREDSPSMSSGGNGLVHHMKLCSDRHPFQGEVKRSSILVQPRRFCMIVTSKYPIEQCFANPEDVAAGQRRFKELKLLLVE